MELRERFESIDFLRGAAAIAVCLYHFTNGITDFLPDQNALKTVCSFGHLGVEVFFIISGFIIPFSMQKGHFSNQNVGTFFSKRLLRIEPPYIISILLAVLLKYLSSLSPMYRGPAFSLDLSGLLFHLGYLCDIVHKDWLNPVYWTLAIEFQFYILMACCYTFFISNPNRYVFYAFILLMNIPLLAGFTSTTYIFHFMPYFSLGMILFRTMSLQQPASEWVILSVLTVSGIAALYGWAPAIVSIVTLMVIVRMKYSNRFFRFAGSISYSLYLIHIMIGTRLLNLSIHYTQNVSVRIGLIILTLMISLFAAWIFYRLIEKPFMKVSHRIKYEPDPVP